MPSGPGDYVDNEVITVTDRFAVGVSVTGGRLFGFGVRKSVNGQMQEGYDQWFRIDWYDGRLPQPISVRYHVFRSKAHNVIWTP